MEALAGIRIVEFAGLGPAPFCAMMLSDLGADVVRVDRPSESVPPGVSTAADPMNRGRPSIAVDLKHPQAAELVLQLIASADGLLEGFRPGVMERLGLGPDECLARNGRLVYGRVTGWGQDGPYAQEAGHDLNFLALTGVLDSIGRCGSPPTPPLNLLADFGGGGMLLTIGVLAALLEARSSGKGQVVDAAMTEGASLLATMIHGWRSTGEWRDERGTNINDSGAHFYDVYETSDSRYVSIAALEPKFYANLLVALKLDAARLPDQFDRARWPEMAEVFANIFAQETLEEWTRRLEGAEVCFAPVMSLADAPQHPHNLHRGAFLELDGVMQPAPAPRLSRTPPRIRRAPAGPGQDTAAILAAIGFDSHRIEELYRLGVVA